MWHEWTRITLNKIRRNKQMNEINYKGKSRKKNATNQKMQIGQNFNNINK